MFSQTAEYALRACVTMAQSPDQPLTTAQIAERTKVPPGYLSKVLQMLTREGLIQATRGLHGGYQLLIPSGDLTILQVVNAVDPIKRIRTCPLGLEEHGASLCPLHRRMDNAMAEVEVALSGTTLAEVISEPSGSIPLCPGPGRFIEKK